MSEYARVENAEDKAFGLREKYAVTRIGGTPHKHDDCDYFVLDWNHDRYARVAALAYADACEAEFPALAADLRKRATQEPPKWVPHIVKEGSREHVVWWDADGAHCKETRCEMNRPPPGGGGEVTPTSGSMAERLMVNAQLLSDEGRVGMANDIEAGAKALAASQEQVRRAEQRAGLAEMALRVAGMPLPPDPEAAPEPPGEEAQ